MNKQEIENKLEEILYKDKELIEDIVDGKLSYGIATSFLEEINKQIFNFALELAAEKSKILNCSYLSDSLNNKEEVLFIVDKQSILNLKL